jgi:hypothetical protein
MDREELMRRLLFLHGNAIIHQKNPSIEQKYTGYINYYYYYNTNNTIIIIVHLGCHV